MMAGKLNKRVSILSPISTARSTDGAPIITYTTVLKDIWAAADPIGGSEKFKSDYRWAQADVNFMIRYTTAGITSKMKVVHNSANYDIKAVINSGESNRSLELICKRTT